jgi:hypothetical protein
MLNDAMSQKIQPKYRFSKRLDNGDYLTLAVWPGKSKPEDEVLSIQIRRVEGEWKTVGRLAVYRAIDGIYSQLAEQNTASSAKAKMSENESKIQDRAPRAV